MARIRPKPKKKNVRGRKAPKIKVSLTRLAVQEVENLLTIQYLKKEKPLPEATKLRRLAERFYQKHFG